MELKSPPKQPLITANNSAQNLGVPRYDRPNALGNLSVENPTIEQLNAGIQGAGISDGEPRNEPAFGEHIREAAGVVLRLIR